MRIIVTGASGNVGSKVVQRLVADPAVTEVVGLCRRPPMEHRAEVSWTPLDLTSETAATQLTAAFTGADAVIHLAWLLQPSHQPAMMRATNIDGTAHVLRAIEQAGVPALVYASSLGAYSPGPDKTTRVTEAYATGGIPGSLYSQHKSEAERMLDTFEQGHPGVRVVRIRPAIVLQREAAAEQAALFLGRLIPTRVVRRNLIPIAPIPQALTIQVVHADDIADLFVRATLNKASTGAYNGAAEPPLDPAALAGVLRARLVTVPAAALRTLVDLTWRLHLQPTDPGWVDLGLRAPMMDTSRAKSDLGWSPVHAADATLAEALDGMADGAGGGTPALAGVTGPLRQAWRALTRQA